MFVAAGAGAGVSEVFVVIGFDHLLDKGTPLHFIFKGSYGEAAFVGPVALVPVVRVTDDYILRAIIIRLFEDGVVSKKECITMSVYRDIERILPLEYRHGHGVGPGISALFCFFDLPVFGDCPVLSIVPARHVHLDAVQLIARPIKFGGIDHGLVLGVAAIYIEIVRSKFPVGTVDQYVIKGGADAVDGIRT